MRCLPILVALCSLTTGSAALAQEAPFKIETVASGLEHPWAMALLPDGNLLVTERPGRLQMVDLTNGKKTAIGGMPAIRVESEAGALGLALDPAFAANGQLYLCYSTDQAGKAGNRLSRFTLTGNQLGGERVLIDNLPGAKWHNGCRVALSPDGYLYASMGDATEAQTAQDGNSLGGKIFRINRDGSVPADNPFAPSPIWSYGHRNPQGLAFRPADGALWSTEHGADTQDEVNLIEKGGNYGWPLCRGIAPCTDLANDHSAVAEFNQGDTIAISDLIFYRGKAFHDWQGDILFVSLKTGRLYHLDLDGNLVRAVRILIDGDFGRLRTLVEAPDGSLYLATDNGEDQILHLTLH